MTPPGTPHRARVHLVVRDIHCWTCALTLEDLIAAFPGVLGVFVDRVSGRTTIEFDTTVVEPADLAAALGAGGYVVEEPGRAARRA